MILRNVRLEFWRAFQKFQPKKASAEISKSSNVFPFLEIEMVATGIGDVSRSANWTLLVKWRK